MKTYLIRADGITAVWFAGHVISAWYDVTGDSANLWLAHACTSRPPINDLRKLKSTQPNDKPTR